jgi:hypothetical protein
MFWSHSEEKEIIVSGDKALVTPLARELATALGGRFEEV